MLTGLGTALVAVPTFGFLSTSSREAAVDIILNELNYLKIDRREVERFVADFYQNIKRNKELYTQFRLKALSLFKVKAEDSDMVELLSRNFISSTDFFINKMDESKPVRYLGIYNAYRTPCANPFSFVYYPPSVT
jgi:hypothetical protein